MLLQRLHQISNGRSLLTDGYINTVYGLASLIETFLIDDGIHSNSCLTRLAVTNDELTLSTTNRNH